MTEFELQRYLQVMKHCILLAQKGQYTCLPNPQVGCVIEHKHLGIIAKGWHEAAGQPHAEINALHALHAFNCINDIHSQGSLTVYITLEPCCHYAGKKTGSCADALMALKPKKVVILMLDCNPFVAGKGVAQLRNAGIEVVVLEQVAIHAALSTLIQEYCWNNRHYIHYIKHKKPYITIKTATSLDGKIALKNGKSQWVTNEQSRTEVQKIRASACVVLTGMGTFLADNPSLQVRDEILLKLPFFKQPQKWLWDKRDRGYQEIDAINDIKINKSFKVLNAITGEELYTKINNESENKRIAHVLIEGGAGINSLLLPWVNEIIWFQAPKIMGNGLSPFDKIENEIIPPNEWKIQKTELFEEDICRWFTKAP